MSNSFLPPHLRAHGVTAILGPTNTGKTYYAIERMVAHGSGIIGLPLRLLAREVYQRITERVGIQHVALVTGEEKIKPEQPRYWVCTVEAMPRDLKTAFVAIDEIQLAADLDRGHIFTDRLLNQRGTQETLLLGSDIIRPLIEILLPGVHITSRPRLSQLTYGGAKKISRLPPRSAIVAFSVDEVYTVGELIRRQKGGAAIVLGALSPRTRNAQVELYQSGEVDYIVATDAIGMGLNLNVHHVAFASARKFDGFHFRALFPSELAQIAGRAGRHHQDGTFGTTGRCEIFDDETISAIENHHFDPLHILQWRTTNLDFTSLNALRHSLETTPKERGLTRTPIGEDVRALETLAQDDAIRDMIRTQSDVELLWETCQIPDYRKVSPQAHADLVSTIFQFLKNHKKIPTNWFKRQIYALNQTDGDLDTLSNRISQVRTWNFVANHPDWLRDSVHWQIVTRQVEDLLSDALHERLTQRFVDRRTSVLLRRLKENKMLEAEISTSGEVIIEGQNIGTLSGFCFTPDSMAATEEMRTLRLAAQNALQNEIATRADRFSETADSNLVLSNNGVIRWMGEPVAKLEAGDKILEPRFRLIADDLLSGASLEKVEIRLNAWLKAYIARLLEPLFQLETASDIEGIARGLAFQLFEGLGILERAKVLQDVRNLDQEGRASLRRLGVRFGGYHLFLPALLKPAPRLLATQLWALSNGGLEQKGLDDIAFMANSGRTSFPVDPDIAPGFYRAAGFRICGNRALRVDILERLADLIRPAIAYRPGITPGAPPPGTADDDSFVSTVAMTSLVGCAGEDFAIILQSLGYVSEKRKGPAITVPLVEEAATVSLSHQPSNDTIQSTDGAETSVPDTPHSATTEEPSTIQTENILSVPEQESPPEELPPSDDTSTAMVSDHIVTDSSSDEPELKVNEDPEQDGNKEPEMVEVWRQQKRSFAHRNPKDRSSPYPEKRKRFFPKGEKPQDTQQTAAEGSNVPSNSEQRKSGNSPEPFSDRNKDKNYRKDISKYHGKEKHKGYKGKQGEKQKEFYSPRKEREPDPNSPFAKLLALKEQLADDKTKK